MLLRSIISGLILVLLNSPLFAQLSGEQRLDVMNAPGDTESDEVEVAVSGEIVYAVWFEQDPVTGRDLYFARSLDGGASWSTPIRIDEDPGTGDQDNPIVLAQDNVVVVAWLDDRSQALVDDVFARTSHDFGATFAAENPLSGSLQGDAGDADALRGAISLPFVHVCFEDNVNAQSGTEEDLFVASSGDGGLSFSAPQLVNHPPGGAGSADVDRPNIDAVGAIVHFAWVDRRTPGADHVYYNVSTDGGVSYSATDVRLDTSGPLTADTSNPSMHVSGSRLFVTWGDERDDAGGLVNKLYMNASRDGGVTWLGDVRVDTGPVTADALRARVSSVGDTFFVTWPDNRNDLVTGRHDLFFRRGSVDSGAIVLGAAEERMDVGSAPGAANTLAPRIAYRSGCLFLAYEDSRKDVANDINDSYYLRISKDLGLSFSPELDASPGAAVTDDVEETDLVIGSSLEAILIWVDNRNDLVDPRNNDVFTNIGTGEVGVASCFGTGCPCGNDDPTAGCANSTGVGALLSGTGSSSIGLDDLVLTATQLPPNNSGLFYMGDAIVGNPFFDGKQCALGTTFRFLNAIQNGGAGGVMALGPGIVADSVGLITPSSTWHFHAWHRDASPGPGPCGTGANLTNLYSVTFAP